jgi:exopolysaccharide biosynthesis protein
MATTLTISPGENTTLTINGTSTTYDVSGESTTLTLNTAVAATNATDIMYSPTGRMSAVNVQTALDEIAGDYFMQAAAPSGSQLNEGDLWYDTDDDELKVYRGTAWQTLAGAGGDVETMMSLDGGSF